MRLTQLQPGQAESVYTNTYVANLLLSCLWFAGAAKTTSRQADGDPMRHTRPYCAILGLCAFLTLLWAGLIWSFGKVWHR